MLTSDSFTTALLPFQHRTLPRVGKLLILAADSIAKSKLPFSELYLFPFIHPPMCWSEVSPLVSHIKPKARYW